MIRFLGMGGGVDGGYEVLFIGFFYVCFMVGQVILFVLMRTRPDVSLSRVFGSFDARLLTLLYAFMLMLPFFISGYDSNTDRSIPSFASKYIGFLFSNSSDTVALLLVLVIFLLYLYIFGVVIYERFTRTNIEVVQKVG
jgi:hypothetical protein